MEGKTGQKPSLDNLLPNSANWTVKLRIAKAGVGARAASDAKMYGDDMNAIRENGKNFASSSARLLTENAIGNERSKLLSCCGRWQL